MIERAILWIPHPQLLWQRAGGLTVLERQLFTASRAGIRTVWAGMQQPAESVLGNLRLPPGLEVLWVTPAGPSAAECAPPYLGVSADHFIRVETLAHIARQDYAESLSFQDASGLSVIQVVLRHEEGVARRKLPLPAGSFRRLEVPLSTKAALEWLMSSGPKRSDGFMARYFDRHISMAVSRRLLDTRVTPNQMTIFSTLMGLFGSAFFLAAARPASICGAALVWLHSVLDGCDGELARVRFQESPLGSDLDFWGDNLVHVALFSCLGIGFRLGGGGDHHLVLAAVADAGVVASSWTAWRHRLAQRRRDTGAPESGVTEETGGSGFNTRLARLENTLAQRDFIYLLVFLAAIDRLHEFLWAAAVGGVLYFAIMLYLGRVNENEQARRPHPAR